MANIADKQSISPTLQAIRARLDLTQEQLAERLGVSFATVNRWEGGTTMPQKAARTAIAALAAEAGIDTTEPVVDEVESAARVTRRRSRRRKADVPTTKPMEQMLWDAACSIRGAKDAAKFKDYLLPLLFLKRLSDVFDDDINRLAQEYGDRAVAQEIAESDHQLLRFYLPPEARWGVVSGREAHEWLLDNRGRSTRPSDIGEHLTSVRYNPTLSGVIDLVDFASERNGERELNPARLAAVVETFSDPRYRLGLADVQPDFLGRAFTELLREREAIDLSRPTVRRILTRAGMGSPRSRRSPQHRFRRRRMPQKGMLVQVDGSHHRWLEERGPKLVLLLAVDDATGAVAQAIFRTTEDTRGYMVLLEGLIRQWGVPLALYSDRHSAFKHNVRLAQLTAEPTQFAKMMQQLGIRQIFALSPQAKGRVERMASTLQDRLITELRLTGASTIDQPVQRLSTPATG